MSILLLSLFFSACATSTDTRIIWCTESDSEKETDYLSFGKANSGVPQSSNGNTVRMHGRLSYKLEDVALYPLGDNSAFKPVWLEFDSIVSDLHPTLIGKHGTTVTITGNIDLTNKGYADQYVFTLNRIVCLREF